MTYQDRGTWRLGSNGQNPHLSIHHEIYVYLIPTFMKSFNSMYAKICQSDLCIQIKLLTKIEATTPPRSVRNNPRPLLAMKTPTTERRKFVPVKFVVMVDAFDMIC